MEIKLTTGDLLRQARKQQQLSLTAASALSGISASWIGAIEKGAEPKLADYLSLCRIYQVCWVKVINLACFGRCVPSFSNDEYENEKLNRLDFSTADLVHAFAKDHPENSTEAIWLGTLTHGRETLQIQLVLTSEPERMVDES